MRLRIVRKGNPARVSFRGKALLRGALRDSGQAALAMVLGITLLLTTGGAILASTAIQHDPLVQNDVVQHFAYRALEAGSNAFLDNVNANPNLINCTASSPSGGECNPTEYNSWKQVDNTSGSGIVPEWYLWENPVFCSGTSTTTGKCIALTGTANLAYVEVTIYGAAGFPGHIDYQDSSQVLTPENGFLSRVWWSNYESTDPQLTGSPTSACTWDWNNNYNGPDLLGTGDCSAVYFGPNDIINGPIFSNDTIWVSGDPTLGPVETADSPIGTGCLFYDQSNGCITAPNNSIVNQSTASAAGDADNQTKEPLPQTDSSLKAIALLNGCVYYGPTTITFDTNDMMSVWSPDTSTSSSCMPSTAGGQVQVPNGAHGNGVIYIDNATTVGGQTCSETDTSAFGANPFDNWNGSSNGGAAQWGTVNGAFYDYAGSTSSPDCEGDAFVSDNPSGGGVSGQLTIATANDIIVTGNVEYTDCGGSFNSTSSGPCSYNAGGTNDALGLIANQYVEVNHPVVPNCTTTTTTSGHPPKTTTTTTCTGVTSSSTLEGLCGSSAMGTPSAAVCDPTDGTSSHNSLTIDAAILALNQSYLVNNWTIGNPNGTLIVYGSIDQDYRGAVGTFSGSSVASGYSKDYDWDSRLEYVTPPYYLTPGTPAWGLASSATDLTPGAPTCSGCGIPPT